MVIPYPWDISWLPEPGKPVGLLQIAGWIEAYDEEVLKKQPPTEDREGWEVYSSDIYDENDIG